MAGTQSCMHHFTFTAVHMHLVSVQDCGDERQSGHHERDSGAAEEGEAAQRDEQQQHLGDVQLWHDVRSALRRRVARRSCAAATQRRPTAADGVAVQSEVDDESEVFADVRTCT